ncbi:MAG TPA: hypothetical protein VK644_00225 [Chitinophagaceae bacterium]|nr:hypothetical protein [Chitinophagaceae bacterium]
MGKGKEMKSVFNETLAQPAQANGEHVPQPCLLLWGVAWPALACSFLQSSIEQQGKSINARK